MFEQNDKWLEETGGDRKKLKNYFNCEFKPIQIKNGKEWEEVIKTFPPDPLHCNLLGPVNSCLEIMESLWKEYMESYYRKHGLTKSGQGIGGNFNGVDIRLIIKENNLQELSLQLPVEAEAFLNYMRSIRELHSAVVASDYSYSRCERAIFNFETNFWYMHEAYKLPMTL